MSDLLKKEALRKGLYKFLKRLHIERTGFFKFPPRLLIFLTIYENSPIDAGSIRVMYPDIDQPTISHEIGELCVIGYVDRTRESYDGRKVTYTLSDRGYDAMDEWMAASIQSSNSE